MSSYRSRLDLNRLLSHSLSVGTLTILSLMLGLAPNLHKGSLSLAFGEPAYAQAVKKEEVTSYARSVLEMEPFRQAAYDDIKKILGTPPNIACSEPASLRTLPANAQSIAIKYCNQSQKIVQSNGLDIGRFNKITVDLRNDPELEKRIQAEMVRIQSSGK